MEEIVDRIRILCQKNKTSITKIEQELGYANGTIGKWRKSARRPPLEKVLAVAERLGTTTEYLYNGTDTKKAPTQEGERKVTDEEIKFALFGGDGDITDAMYDEVKRFAQMVKLREEAEKQKKE